MTNKDSKDLSLMFYHYLCRVIGTEDVVRKRRQIFTVQDNVDSEQYLTLISSGSKAEGLDLDGSDFDLMFLHNDIQVYENDKVTYFSGTYPAVMDTSDCKPGFTQLKAHFKSPYYKYCEYKAGDWYISSQYFRDSRKELNPFLITHGPCNTFPDGTIDFAFCLRCKNWISQARSWLLRAQMFRINNAVVNKIIEFGVLYVPVGCKNSPNMDIEWRISFSFAEKLLIWSFNHVQLLCYALLKILLKEVIKHTTGDLLCSYFIKTIMLWVCEETNSSQWESNNIISCFMACLNRLIYCVEYKTCAHYFIPENNLFENRFNRQEHKLLLSTLNQLQSFGWTCLLQTKTLRSFRNFLEQPLSFIMHKSSYLQCLEHLDRVRCSFNWRCVYFCRHARTNDFYIYKFTQINLMTTQDLDIRSNIRDITSGNKQRYSIYRKGLCHILIGLNHDAVSGWFILASFFYARKQYKICKFIIANGLLACSPDKCLSVRNIPIENQTSFEFLRIMFEIKPIRLIRKYVIHFIHFTPSSQIIPEEMDILKDGTEMLFPPTVFGLFLNFLCNYHLGNRYEQIDSLRRLKMMIDGEYLIVNNKQLEQAHKLLSVARFLTND